MYKEKYKVHYYPLNKSDKLSIFSDFILNKLFKKIKTTFI